MTWKWIGAASSYGWAGILLLKQVKVPCAHGLERPLTLAPLQECQESEGSGMCVKRTQASPTHRKLTGLSWIVSSGCVASPDRSQCVCLVRTGPARGAGQDSSALAAVVSPFPCSPTLQWKLGNPNTPCRLQPGLLEWGQGLITPLQRHHVHFWCELLGQWGSPSQGDQLSFWQSASLNQTHETVLLKRGNVPEVYHLTYSLSWENSQEGKSFHMDETV